ncbi:MAG: hypothetical protein LBO76_01690 [Treponema sp.]|jgi:hypothetical protein|nr:hypothetical protein [Treponema sp.]
MKAMRGHSAYLMRNTGTETECLFESCFSVPLFWLTLIDTKVIKKLGEEIKRLFLRSARRIMSNSRTTIKLPREYMLKNAETGKAFFRKFHPGLLGLYGEFAAYLARIFREGDTLELDIIEITDFAATVRSLNQVRDVVRSIRLGESPRRYFEIFGPGQDPLSMTGDDRRFRNQFREFSASFAACCDKEEKERRKNAGPLGNLRNFLTFVFPNLVKHKIKKLHP